MLPTGNTNKILPSVEQISDSDDGVMEPEGSLPASRSHVPGSDVVPPTVQGFDTVTSTERLSGPCAGHASDNILPPIRPRRGTVDTSTWLIRGLVGFLSRLQLAPLRPLGWSTPSMQRTCDRSG